ncbi:MAG TPA: amidohydrolase family protein [Methylomirabilota bacterium]|jgi:predicted TIM-barrel fold metal-dependent hydrolase
MDRLAALGLLALVLFVPVPHFADASADTVPIIDLHFHPDQAWDVHALVKLFDELGVAAAGNGARGSDAVALKFAEQYPGRFIPYGGNEPIRGFIGREGERAYTLQTAAVGEYLGQLETAVQAKQFKGIGELVINSVHSRADKASKYPADSPLMRRLWALSAKYGIPMSAHMDATPESLQEMERLLASDRAGTWVWAHTGWLPAADPALLRRLLAAHPNLFCELSGRESIRRIYRGDPIDEAGVLKPEWKALLEDLPDRFVIGTDVDPATLKTYAEEIGYWRGILAQLSPATAAKLAHGNAERLLKLPPTPRR